MLKLNIFLLFLFSYVNCNNDSYYEYGLLTLTSAKQNYESFYIANVVLYHGKFCVKNNQNVEMPIEFFEKNTFSFYCPLNVPFSGKKGTGVGPEGEFQIYNAETHIRVTTVYFSIPYGSSFPTKFVLNPQVCDVSYYDSSLKFNVTSTITC